jgi:hypothetical protein
LTSSASEPAQDSTAAIASSSREFAVAVQECKSAIELAGRDFTESIRRLDSRLRVVQWMLNLLIALLVIMLFTMF